MDNENQFNEMDVDDIQKEVFAENLRYYIELNQKQQIDVAKDLGINPTTLRYVVHRKIISKVRKASGIG